MIRIVLSLFEDVEQEMEGYNYSPDELKKVGDMLKDRMYNIADAMDKLEKLGWEWTTSYRTILLWKQTTHAQAKKQIHVHNSEQFMKSFEEF